MGCGGDGGRDRAGQAGLNDAENEMLITGGDFHRGFSRKSGGARCPAARARSSRLQLRDSLFGGPQPVGEEAVIDDGRQVAVAIRQARAGGGVAYHDYFKALFEQFAQV